MFNNYPVNLIITDPDYSRSVNKNTDINELHKFMIDNDLFCEPTVESYMKNKYSY